MRKNHSHGFSHKHELLSLLIILITMHGFAIEPLLINHNHVDITALSEGSNQPRKIDPTHRLRTYVALQTSAPGCGSSFPDDSLP